MQPMRRLMGLFAAALLLAPLSNAAAQDANITQPVADLEQLLAAEPLVITHAEISRPKAKGDITLRAEVSFGGAPPLRVKLRKAEPGANSFNNVPRYDIAAYELQKLFLDPAEYVVPPTALRMVPLADFAKYSPGVARTFLAADQVLAVVQYWLSDITVVADVYSPGAFCRRPGLCAPHRPAERAHLLDQASRLEPRQLSDRQGGSRTRACFPSITVSRSLRKIVIAAKYGRTCA